MSQVAVIIPIYNVKAYLRACLDSVLAQTFTDWTALLVDDASTDGSDAIAEEYCSRDPRFRLLRLPENRGQSAARNLALDSLPSEIRWVTFIDSDDTVHREYLSRMLPLAAKANLVMTDLTYDYCKTTIKEPLNSDGRTTLANMLYQQNGVNSSPCAKLYAASLLKNIRFKYGSLHEDLEILVRILGHTSTVTHSLDRLYLYRNRPGSSLNSFSKGRLDVLEVTRQIEERFADDPELLAAARDRRLSANFNMFILLTRNGVSEGRDECWVQIKRLRRQSLFNPRVRFKNKAGILASYLLGKRLFAKVVKLI